MQIAGFASIGIIGITVLVFVMIFATNPESDIAEVEDTLNKEIRPVDNPEIQKKIDEIQKITNSSTYIPLEREWITSGPFQFDRSEYAIGESIFIRIGGLETKELGEIAIYRPINATHQKTYLTIPFNGEDESAHNTYFTPQISKYRGICSTEDLTGEWKAVFRNTDYPSISFKINEKVLPGTDITSVC